MGIESAGNFLKHLFTNPINKQSTTLASLYTRTTGKESAKWQDYLPQYDRWLSPWQGSPVRLLEIGVQAGGSLEIWAAYFTQASKILGCDIDPACEQLRYEDPRIEVVIGDVTDNATVDRIAQLMPAIDIIIDDGSHRSGDVIQTFLSLFPKLSDQGIYIIEDLHCSYWEDYGGGLFHPQSSLSFFKKLVDVINRPAWGVELEYRAFLREFDSMMDNSQIDEALSSLRCINRIEFSNSMCLIQKMPTCQNGLGKLIMSGEKGSDGAATYGYGEGDLICPDQDDNLFAQLPLIDATLENKLLISYEKISRLTEENLALKQKFYESTKQFYDASVHIQQLEFALQTIRNDHSLKPQVQQPTAASVDKDQQT